MDTKTAKPDTFGKNALGLVFSAMWMTLMVICTAIVIATGESATTCIAFIIASLASIASAAVFARKI